MSQLRLRHASLLKYAEHHAELSNGAVVVAAAVVVIGLLTRAERHLCVHVLLSMHGCRNKARPGLE